MTRCSGSRRRAGRHPCGVEPVPPAPDGDGGRGRLAGPASPAVTGRVAPPSKRKPAALEPQGADVFRGLEHPAGQHGLAVDQRPGVGLLELRTSAPVAARPCRRPRRPRSSPPASATRNASLPPPVAAAASEPAPAGGRGDPRSSAAGGRAGRAQPRARQGGGRAATLRRRGSVWGGRGWPSRPGRWGARGRRRSDVDMDWFGFPLGQCGLRASPSPRPGAGRVSRARGSCMTMVVVEVPSVSPWLQVRVSVAATVPSPSTPWPSQRSPTRMTSVMRSEACTAVVPMSGTTTSVNVSS